MNRKEEIRRYKETARPMGVYGVRHLASGRTFIGSSVDVPARLNRLKSQLQQGSHPSRDLQRDWNELGVEAFAFETLDVLAAPADRPHYRPADDLKELEALWREKLGERLYD